METKHDRMIIHDWDGFRVLDLGAVEIWDGADLSLLRETLTRLINGDQHRRIGVNMSYVKYIPSGFFGMLFDWHEKGVSIRLYAPQPHVQNMLWFRQFFDHVEDRCHALRSEAKEMLVSPTDPEWSNEVDWGFEEKSQSVAAAGQD